METPQPFTDWIVGPMTEELQTLGKDEFLDTASKRGLTYVDYNAETGSPMKYRVGRHLSGALEVISWMNSMMPEKEVVVSWPTYEELMENDCGHYLYNPETSDPSRVFEI